MAAQFYAQFNDVAESHLYLHGNQDNSRGDFELPFVQDGINTCELHSYSTK